MGKGEFRDGSIGSTLWGNLMKKGQQAFGPALSNSQIKKKREMEKKKGTPVQKLVGTKVRMVSPVFPIAHEQEKKTLRSGGEGRGMNWCKRSIRGRGKNALGLLGKKKNEERSMNNEGQGETMGVAR